MKAIRRALVVHEVLVLPEPLHLVLACLCISQPALGQLEICWCQIEAGSEARTVEDVVEPSERVLCVCMGVLPKSAVTLVWGSRESSSAVYICHACT